MIAGGVSHSLAVKNDGSVWGWGSNSAKQVDPSSDEDSVAAHKGEKSNLCGVRGLRLGFSAALLSDGTITVWGGGADFATVPGLTGVADLSVGQSTLVALKSNGTVWQWTFGSSAPEQVPGLERISSVAAGGTLSGPWPDRRGVGLGEQQPGPAGHRLHQHPGEYSGESVWID